MITHASPDARRILLREDIRRQTLELLDRRWNQLWSSFGISVILLGFGAGLGWRQGPEALPQALALLAAGALVAWLHVHQHQAWQGVVKNAEDWLSRRDQCLVALGLWLAVLAPAGASWWPAPLLAASIYGVWRLASNAQRHWAQWHFRVARQTLRARPGETIPSKASP